MEGIGEEHMGDFVDEVTVVETDEMSEIIPLDDENENIQNGQDGSDEEMSVSDGIGEEEEKEYSNGSEQDDSDVIIRKAHSKDIFAVHSVDNLLATGGEDDCAHLWSFSLENELKCTHSIDDHQDSVTFVRFNSKNTLLASGDMSGKIVVTDLVTSRAMQTFTDNSDLEWLQWHHTADILLAGGRDGMIWMWLVVNGQGKVFAGSATSCTAGALLPDGKKLLAGYQDGNVLIWDLKECVSLPTSGAARHTDPVVSIDAHQTLSVAASGSQDGTVCIFQPNTGKITCLLNAARSSLKNSTDDSALDEENADIISVSNSVESVSFSSSQPWLVTGTNDGTLTFWDLNTMAARNSTNLPRGVVKTIWLDENSLLAASLDGIVRLFDARDGRLVRQWAGSGAEIFDVTVNRSQNAIITGCADGVVRIFKI